MISARESMKKELYQAQAHLTRVQTALARLPEEFDYPLCFESKLTGIVVKFIELHNAVVIANDYGDGTPYKITGRPESFIEHTDKDVWKPIAFNKERGLYDKQLIWCSDDNMNGLPHLAFYNAIKDSAFSIFGHREGFNWGNMTPAYVDEPWVKIVYDKLKD